MHLSVLVCVCLITPQGEEQLSKYGDTKSAMNMMYTKLKKLIDENL